MTSKELFKKWKEWIILECPCDRNDINELEQIERDLEILEILKQNLYVEKGTGKFKGIEVIQCSLGNQHSEDFEKIKEWLEK